MENNELEQKKQNFINNFVSNYVANITSNVLYFSAPPFIPLDERLKENKNYHHRNKDKEEITEYILEKLIEEATEMAEKTWNILNPLEIKFDCDIKRVYSEKAKILIIDTTQSLSNDAHHLEKLIRNTKISLNENYIIGISINNIISWSNSSITKNSIENIKKVGDLGDFQIQKYLDIIKKESYKNDIIILTDDGTSEINFDNNININLYVTNMIPKISGNVGNLKITKIEHM